MAMSKKDFIAIAQIISRSKMRLIDKMTMAKEFAGHLSTTNNAFDRSQFLDACIVDDGKSATRHEMTDHNIIGLPLGTRCKRIIRLPNGWRIWTATNDYKYGSYIELHDTGRVVSFEVREDAGDEIVSVRPSDDELRKEKSSCRLE